LSNLPLDEEDKVSAQFKRKKSRKLKKIGTTLRDSNANKTMRATNPNGESMIQHELEIYTEGESPKEESTTFAKPMRELNKEEYRERMLYLWS
jgi:hypothetical protein